MASDHETGVHTADESRVSLPAVTYANHVWSPVQTGYYSRREIAAQTGPYKSSVTPRIATWSPVVSASLSADLDDATRALVDFDNYALRTLGADNPVIGPMSAILLRTESASSSQIEHLTTSGRQLALAEIDESNKANALEVIGNVRAMQAALALSGSITEQTVLAMHSQLMSAEPDIAGKYRDRLVWIGKPNAGPIGADFIAPQHDLVRDAISDNLAFARREDLPVLPQAAIAHAQFETIHPFADGNGRTGRALVQALLKNKGLVGHTTVPVSAGLLVDTARYFDALSAYRTGDAGPILASFADASRFAAATGRDLIDELDSELLATRDALGGLRADALAWKVVPLLVGQPVVNAKFLKRALGVSDTAALRAIEQLTNAGVLVERTGFRRNRIWEHDGIITVLDDYAEKLRREARMRG